VALRVEVPDGTEALSDFILFHERVYAYRSARWPAIPQLQLPLLTGAGPYAHGRRLRPFLVRDGGEIVARAVAVIDQHYIDHWREPLGHIIMFEAMPGAYRAVHELMDAACEWLQQGGTQAARAGYGLFEYPFVLDDYESLPPSVARHNPAYYHALLKDAGFETEKGWVDYKIEVRPELLDRYHGALEAARRAGFAIIPLAHVADGRRLSEFTATWNDAFSRHWGVTPFAEDEMAQMFGFFAAAGGFDTSVLAYRGDEPIGALMVMAESSVDAALKPGRMLADSEKLNFLGIGVRQSARGRGVSLAMASYAYLELIRRGAKYLSYTLVLDDNWSSRRTAEKLGGRVCANYVVYRRNFTR
jgi:hypothetical protein